MYLLLLMVMLSVLLLLLRSSMLALLLPTGICNVLAPRFAPLRSNPAEDVTLDVAAAGGASWLHPRCSSAAHWACPAVGSAARRGSNTRVVATVSGQSLGPCP
jgi:hypothetical protein